MATLITNNGIQRMDDNALEHFGILGMKWGIRRFQPYGEGGYNPKKKGKYVGQLNPQQKREYKISKQENRERAARATVGAGAAATILTAAGVFSPYSIPVSMLSTAAVNTGINFIKNHKYKTFLKEQNEIHDEQIGIGRDYVKSLENKSSINTTNEFGEITGKTSSGKDYTVSKMITDQKSNGGYRSGDITIGGREIPTGTFDTSESAEKVLSKIAKNFDSYESVAKSRALKEADDWIKNSYNNELPSNYDAFKKDLKVQHIFVTDTNGDRPTAEMSFYTMNNNDLMTGHSIDVEIDLKTKKVTGVSVNG